MIHGNNLKAENTFSDAGFGVKYVHVLVLKMGIKHAFSFGHVRIIVDFVLKFTVSHYFVEILLKMNVERCFSFGPHEHDVFTSEPY